jgi:formylmethanofuran dehydrogenase subunit E
VVYLNNTLKKIEEFHGHVGPYVLIGYRMGQIANKELGKDPFSKNATIYSGTSPPVSCIVDGVQISSGCTLGKGNITIKNENCAKVDFSNKSGRKISIELNEEIRKEIEKTVTKENLLSYSEKLYEKSNEELFKISKK